VTSFTPHVRLWPALSGLLKCANSEAIESHQKAECQLNSGIIEQYQNSARLQLGVSLLSAIKDMLFQLSTWAAMKIVSEKHHDAHRTSFRLDRAYGFEPVD
jgi:hypothetical protein